MMRRARFRLILLAIGLVLYGFAKASIAVEQPDITVGSKNFTESLILGELYALSLEKAGYKVKRTFNLGGTLMAHEALKRGEIDLYPEYTGTGLINVLHQTPSANSTDNNSKLFSAYRQQWNLRWLTPSRANNSQALVVTRKTAEQYHLYTLSRLNELAPKLALAAIPEFEERQDGLKGLRQTYGHFQFKQVSLYDNGLKYRVLLNGQADVTVGFTTDGELADSRLVVLRDDHHFWPAYEIAPVVRARLLPQYPLAEGWLNRVSAALSTEKLQTLNARVDLRHEDFRQVARDFLQAEGVL